MRDLSDPYEADRRQQADVRRQKASTMLQNSSITQGGLRVASANGILAQSVAGGNPAVRVTGLQVVDGTLRITGTLEGGGTWTWTGTLTQTGTTNLNGPWNMNGAGKIAGNVTQTGNTTQQGNVDVTGGGKITAGNVTVEPNKITVGAGSTAATLQNGELALSNGAKLAVGLTGGTSSIGLLPGGSADVSVNTSTAWLRATGSSISVTTAIASITAPNIFMVNLPTGAPAGAKAVLVDPLNGKFYRAT